MLVRIDEESACAAVTGQMVVYSAIVSVTTTVETAPLPRDEMAATSLAAGQLVTVAAHEMTV